MNRQLTRGISALMLTWSLGCGADRAVDDTVASEQEELATESELAVDETEALADVADEDATFADLTLGATDKEARYEDRGRPGPAPRRVRVHLGRWLRSLTRAGAFLCGASATVERETADAGCTLIGRGGQYLSKVAVKFDGCELPLGIRIDGGISVTTTKALSAGATCDAAGLSVDITHAATVRDLKVSVRALGSAEVGGTATVKAVRGPGAAQPKREWTLDHTRKLSETDGTVRLDQHLTGAGTTVLDASGSEPALVRNGTFTAELNLRGVTVTTRHTDVRRVKSCCHPIGGSIEISATKGADTKARTIAFGPACGQATVDGAAHDLATCM